MNAMSEQAASASIPLSDRQREILARSHDESFAVLGAPGSGKTTLLIEMVATHVTAGRQPEQVLALAANRKQAAELRERIAARLQTAVRGGGLGRTVASISHEIVAIDRARNGQTPPRLLTGSQQDAILRDVIAGATDPDAAPSRYRGELPWPENFSPETPQLAGFRAELRELFAAMATYGVSPEQLAELSLPYSDAVAKRQRHRALWRAVSRLANDYQYVLGSAYDASYDVANMTALAANLVAAGVLPAADAEIKLVVIDDAQELTESGRQLIAAFEARGARIISFGDPDVATGPYHGGVAEYARSWRAAGETAPPVEVLDTRFRHTPAISTMFADFAARIGVADDAWQHRAAVGGKAAEHKSDAVRSLPEAAMAEVGSIHEEATLVAGYLRRLHLLESVPWSQLAVIARSSATLTTIERTLNRAGIPTTTNAPVRAADDSVVRAILTLAKLAQCDPKVWSLADIQRVLASELFGVDALKFRRIRRAMVVADIAASQRASAGDSEAAAKPWPVLPGACSSGSDLVIATIAAELADERHSIGSEVLDALEQGDRTSAQLARAVRQLVTILRGMRRQLAAHAPLDIVLFVAWDDPERNARWQRTALGDTPEAVAINRRLDAVVALFDRAKRFVERNPDASLEAFLAEWHNNSVVDDSLGGARRTDAVTLTTPASAVGYAWRGVAVVGVNEGAWPNLRVRDTLLGAGRLLEALQDDAAANIIDRRRQVLYDESRMLLAAMSRASDYLLLTAINSDEVQPSPYLRQLQLPLLDPQLVLSNELTVDYRLLGVGALTGHLRRELANTGDRDAALALTRLARARVPGTDPAEWFAARGRSTEAPLVTVTNAHTELRLRPSSIKGFLACPLNWFIEQHAFGSPSSAQTVGNIIHEALEQEAKFNSVVEFQQWVHDRLQLLDFEADWAGEVQRGKAEGKALRLWEYLQWPGSQRAIGYETTMHCSFDEHLVTEAGEVDVTLHISGQIDRIETDEHGVRIVDFKTGRRPAKAEQVEYLPQLWAYQVGYELGALDEQLAQVLEREGESKQFRAGRLVFEKDVVKPPHFELIEHLPLDEAELAVVRQTFARIALQQHGVLPAEDADPDNPVMGATAAAPQFIAELGTHCTSSWGTSAACALHILPEVTE